MDRNKEINALFNSIRKSPSSRRAWIEIVSHLANYTGFSSPSSRRAWIEIRQRDQWLQQSVSPSSRRAWIEIVHGLLTEPEISGSPSSRRAWIEIQPERAAQKRPQVALLAEGVDRNYDGSAWAAMTGRSPSSRRAWIEIYAGCYRAAGSQSPSSRRAWIEIGSIWSIAARRRSPSSRRAWIEISRQQSREHRGPGRPPRGGRG